MVDFKKLKAMSGKKSLDALAGEMDKMNKGGFEKDTRYWKPTIDKAGNSYAVIRFLPPHEEEDGTWFVRFWDHGFQGPGGWYIERSRTSLGDGEADPVTEYNSTLWNSTTDDNSPARKQARNQKRRLHYVSNIYVVEDPGNPENEGKVFLYDYGVKIFDKINEAMHPKFPDKVPFNPFDLWDGANFKLKVHSIKIGDKKVPNYDLSEFAANGPLADDDTMEQIFSQQYKLKPIVDPSTFKSYDALKVRLDKVLGDSSNATKKAENQKLGSKSAPAFKESRIAADDDSEVDDESVPFDTGEEEEDSDTMNYLANLANRRKK